MSWSGCGELIDALNIARRAFDGAHLEAFLSEHPEIVERYFGTRYAALGLGRPALIANPLASGFSGRSVASVPIELRSYCGADMKTVRTRAVIDTAAEMTCVPIKLVKELGATAVDSLSVSSAGGGHSVPVFAMDLAIERLLLPSVRVVGIDWTCPHF
jgi:hypothetical protein